MSGKTIRIPAAIATRVMREMAEGKKPQTGKPVTHCRECSLVNACAAVAACAKTTGCFSGWRWEDE